MTAIGQVPNLAERQHRLFLQAIKESITRLQSQQITQADLDALEASLKLYVATVAGSSTTTITTTTTTAGEYTQVDIGASDLSKYAPVMMTDAGAVLATTTDDTYANGVIGIMAEDAAAGTRGYVARTGDTLDSPDWAWTQGALLWLADGTITETRPDIDGSTTLFNAVIGVALTSTQIMVLCWPLHGALKSAYRIVTESTATRTFVWSDRSLTEDPALISAAYAGAKTFTVPPNSSVPYPVGTQLNVLHKGTGTLTIAAGAGVTVTPSANMTLVSETVGAVLILVQITADDWILIGGPPLYDTFLSLTDTPSSYSGGGLQWLRVNTGETAIEAFTPPEEFALTDDSSGSRTLQLSDRSTTDAPVCLRPSHATANTVTVPPNSSVAFPIGSIVPVLHYGAGTLTFVAGSGVTLNPPPTGTLVSLGQGGMFILFKQATDTWQLIGPTVAA